MVQQSEKAEGNALTAKTKKSPRKRATTKRKKKTTTSTATKPTRRRRVKRTKAVSQSSSSATKSDSGSPETLLDEPVSAEAKVASDTSASTAASTSADASTKSEKKAEAPALKTRTLKRSKPRKPSTASSDSSMDGMTRKSSPLRKKPSPSAESGSSSSAKSASSPAASATSAGTTAQPKAKEPFGAGIVRPVPAPTGDAPSAESGSPATEPVKNRATPAGADAIPTDSGETKPPKAKSRRSRGGKAKRKKTTATASPKAEASQTESPDAKKPEPKSEPEQPGTPEEAADHSGETDEERSARIVLKRRPVRRARRSKSRSKSESNADTKAEAASHDSKDTTVKAETVTPAESARSKDTQAEESDAPAQGDAGPAEQPRKSTSTRNRRRRRGQGKSTKKVAAETPADSPEINDAKTVEISEDISVITDDSPKEKLQSEGREMIINSTAGAECRIAILHAGRLEEIYIERQSSASHVGNIYKGKITNVESSIQAAFVDFGLAKNGFLHISDVLPKYFPNKADATEDVGKKVPRRDRPPIQKCFRRGDEVIVQVAKEGVGTKGPTLTTYLSIPGRFVVMMPGMSKLGVSRRIEDDADRKAMRDLLGQLSMPDGMGFILRTAGLNRNKRELQSDLNYLNRLWKTVQKRIKSQATPCELYQESDLVIRTIRDVYSSEFNRIVVDDPKVAMKAKDFLRIAMPRTQGAVVAYQKHEPIFHHYGIEQEIQRIYSRHVPLPSGGSIVIDSTEAMVAIDVNSGKYRDQNDAEETAYRINLEAAEEIARQLRLRDLGGLVVCDFIDMRQDRHKRAVEKALRDALKSHKERARILRMSKFGLIEMTRQRQGPSIKRSVFVDCRHCSGSGLVKTAESMSLEVLRILQLLTHRNDVAQVSVSVAPDVCALVLNEQRSFLHHLETKTNKTISILPDPTFTNDQVSYKCIDDRGMPLRIEV